MYTFFVNSPFQSVKGVNLYWKDDCSFTLTSSNSQVLGNLFIFRESEKGLKDDSKVSLFRKFFERVWKSDKSVLFVEKRSVHLKNPVSAQKLETLHIPV